MLGDFSVSRPRCWRCSSSTERHETNPPSPPVPEARDSQLVRKVDVVRGFTRTLTPPPDDAFGEGFNRKRGNVCHSAFQKNSSMISRSSWRVEALLTRHAGRTPSRSLEYQAHNARSLLMTQRSRHFRLAPRAVDDEMPEAVGFVDALVGRADRRSRAGTGHARAGSSSRGTRPSPRSAACARIHGLRSTPRPTSTPLTPQPSRSTIWSGSMQSPLPEHGNREVARHARHEVPVGRPAV